MSLRQQIAALKQAQEEIISTQAAYKKASRNLLKLIDRNRTLNEANHGIDIHVTVQKSLISATKDMTEKFEKVITFFLLSYMRFEKFWSRILLYLWVKVVLNLPIMRILSYSLFPKLSNRDLLTYVRENRDLIT